MEQPKRRLSQSCEVSKKQKVETEELILGSCEFFPPQPDEVHEEIIGCSVLAGMLRLQIGEPLANPKKYEIEPGGRGIVERFIHWNGCRRNSVTSYLQYFCHTHNINLFSLHKPEIFDAKADFTEAFNLARRNQPAIIYINCLDKFLFRGQDDSAAVMSRECKKIYNNKYKVWVILRTCICNFEQYNPLDHDFYEFFGQSYQPIPLQSDADVAVIIKKRLEHHLPQLTFPGEEIVAFANAYARHCTYFQIDNFLRRVITNAKKKLADSERLANPNPPITMLALSQAISIVTLPTKETISTILPFWPLAVNYTQFRHPDAR